MLEGHVSLDEYGDEGPYGDHTGYYNAVERFPVFTVSGDHHAAEPDLSLDLHRPAARRALDPRRGAERGLHPAAAAAIPGDRRFLAAAGGCSYRIAVVSISKAYPGHAKRVMMGVWSFLRQFMYTKCVIVVDDDIDARDWKDVMWAISTRMDPVRDITLIENTPIDYLDFASPESGLGGKIGLDATNKCRPRPSANGAGRSAWPTRSSLR